MGILQFYPTEIFHHEGDECNLKMKTLYSPLLRDEKGFFTHITNLIDLLEETRTPMFTDGCNSCKFTKKNLMDLIDD